VVVGLYGVLSYFITLRRNEIGIGIALGASRWQVIGVVMRGTATMLLVGLVLGTMFALFAGRGARSMLFGLKAYDPAHWDAPLFYWQWWLCWQAGYPHARPQISIQSPPCALSDGGARLGVGQSLKRQFANSTLMRVEKRLPPMGAFSGYV
jgi:ABC-type antimicrobial peptide transport system permease subunit